MNLTEISTAVEQGRGKKVKELVTQAVDEGISAKVILDEGLISAMSNIGEKFRLNQVYVPEMLVAARAMSMGLSILEPLLTATGVKPIGKIVIGTVRGDLHDIGKNLVAMMLKGMGATIYDLGVDVHEQAFIDKAQEVDADIICLSALLTTTMPAMEDVIKEFEKAGVRSKYCFMIGGAPVSETYAQQIGADIYTSNASDAAESAKAYLLARQ